MVFIKFFVYMMYIYSEFVVIVGESGFDIFIFKIVYYLKIRYRKICFMFCEYVVVDLYN